MTSGKVKGYDEQFHFSGDSASDFGVGVLREKSVQASVSFAS